MAIPDWPLCRPRLSYPDVSHHGLWRESATARVVIGHEDPFSVVDAIARNPSGKFLRRVQKRRS